jgi:hypothetical protein
MPKELISFWRRFLRPLPTTPPYAHPDDLPCLIEKYGQSKIAEPSNFDSFIASTRFGDSKDRQLHLSLLPVPYLGDLRRAEIVILLLNPGLSHTDYWGETKSPAFYEPFRRRLEDSLRQSFSGQRFPFLGLDPQLCWWSGFEWWEKKLHDVAFKISRTHFNGSYFKALRDLSSRVACVELVPYHSSSFGAHSLIKKLPSAQMAVRFVQESLVQDAVAKKRTLIVTRKIEDWGFKRGAKSDGNLIIYEGGQRRGASLGVDTPGGRAILRHYRNVKAGS